MKNAPIVRLKFQACYIKSQRLLALKYYIFGSYDATVVIFCVSGLKTLS